MKHALLVPWLIAAWLGAGLVDAATHAASVEVQMRLTPSGGAFNHLVSITNNGPLEVVLVSLVDAPVADSMNGATLTTPAGYLGLYDASLGIVDFLEEASVFGVGTTVSNFQFSSASTWPAFFTTFEALDVSGGTYRGTIQITIVPPPTIDLHPLTSAATVGTNTQFSVAATSSLPLAYQWQHQAAGTSTWSDLTDGGAFSGVTSATLIVAASGSMNGDQFRVVVSNGPGTGTDTNSSPATLNVTFPPRLVNLSTRALCLTGSDVVIPGFVIGGNTNKRLLIRAVGPTLNTLFGLTTALTDPKMTLKKQIDGVFVDQASNDNWSIPQGGTNVADIVSTSTAVGAFSLANGTADAALLVDLTPGVYTVIADGVDGATGIELVELYDADTVPSTAQLINISNRGFVGTGDQVMIPGFVISSEGPKTLLIRAVGPTLADFGVSGAMNDPQLTVYRSEADGSSTPVRSQDDWSSDSDMALTTAQIAEQVGAFPLAVASKDAALVITLPPGAYTVVGSAADGGSTGVVLVEIYVVP